MDNLKIFVVVVAFILDISQCSINTILLEYQFAKSKYLTVIH